jgi:hypothetical protein
MREICTSGSMRGELVAHPCRLLSYSTERVFDPVHTAGTCVSTGILHNKKPPAENPG